MSGGGEQDIPLSELPPQQLHQLSQQLEQEIEFMQNSLQQLKMVQTKFLESGECLGRMTPETKGKEILVPLTSSMYVAGELEEVERVIVDIGTGYYVDMSVPQAKGHFLRKVEFLTKQMEKVQPLLQDKFKMKQTVMEMMQMKIQAQMAAQQQQQQQTAAAKS